MTNFRSLAILAGLATIVIVAADTFLYQALDGSTRLIYAASLRTSLLLLVAVLAHALLWAQVDPDALASQNVRDYNHVFIAYTIAWLIVLGWLFSLARLLARIERSLER